ncbi:DUF4097 family beta strand repeat-containing protein [Prauserella cavernicola]|uniref:DUF4097 family beta strand repeat protein n=1 Tax=Prauserella cavernicola TaxID=2800127 RepID=A0A934QRA3_9PSEU|nr:DUF4097 family beta strand repeat-containing protein [Prauserella cavernicola]MBK1784726.1 DUF4097 family beta strand repeat protein [Prauserella cavernicola]
MRRAGLAIGGVALIGVGVAFALGWFWPATSEATDQVSDSINRVELDSGSGDVLIRAQEGAETTTVRQRFSYQWGDPEQAYSVEGGALKLTGCGSWCSVDYEVVVPTGTTVGGTVDSGDVTLEDVGDVQVDAKSGDLVLTRVGDVRVTANSGDITGDGLSGTVDAQVDSGDIVLTMDDARDARLSADSGDIELTVPSGSYNVTGTTDSGDREVGVVQDPSADTALDVSTDSGDVVVRAG